MQKANQAERIPLPKRIKIGLAISKRGMGGLIEGLESIVATRNPKRLIFSLPFMPPVVILTQPEDVKSIWKDKQEHLDKIGSDYEVLRGMFGDGQVLARRGSIWKVQKRATGSSLQPTRIPDLDPRIQTIVNEVKVKGEGIFDTNEMLKAISVQISARILFGMDLSILETKQLTDAATIINEFVSRNIFTFPARESLRRKVPVINAKVSEAYRLFLSYADKFLAEGNSPFMNALRAHGLNNGGQLSNEQIRGEVINMVIASYGNLSTAMSWAVSLIADSKTQYLQEQIFAEQAAGKNPTDPDATAKIVFNEAMRLYPPVYIMTRKAINEIRVSEKQGEFTIPKGATVILSPYLIQRNPAIWDRPKDFLPERFKEHIDPATFIPFGYGERVCVGANLAYHIGPRILQQLVSDFHFATIQETQPRFFVNLAPKNNIVITKRHKN